MARVCVFAPVPILTITIEERHGQDDAEIHLHAGGQGYWIARLIAEFGAESVWIKAAKPEPPIPLPVEEVAVELWRERE